MSAFADLVRFVPTAGGTTDWIFSTAVGGCQSPTAAGVVNGVSYKVYAVSSDITQWEVSQGVYSSGVLTFPRTTVLYNSSGTGTAPGQSGAGTKISFATVPQVSIVGLAEDLISVEVPQAFTATQQAQARANISGAWSTYTPTVTPSSGAFTTVSASGGFFVFGKTVFFSVTITITAAGTAAGAMSIPLPVGVANRQFAGVAQESNAVGLMGFWRIAAGGSTINGILESTNATYIATGNVVTVSGCYEQV